MGSLYKRAFGRSKARDRAKGGPSALEFLAEQKRVGEDAAGVIPGTQGRGKRKNCQIRFSYDIHKLSLW